eukprot:TRINITY_DN8120_c0_g1_i1.p1 TRINITY_DN8120_c0_g1~~TRINITY_DN8120_c0_g1_i1.p1  ORF type:complete len:412 (+),score=80.16 TRINITY_DN8120_c0_g1_i1:338-1573(+)
MVTIIEYPNAQYLQSDEIVTPELLWTLLKSHPYFHSFGNITKIDSLFHLNGVHSTTTKLLLENEGSSKQCTLYWKRMVIKDLPERVPWKIRRDVISYNAEVLFYETLLNNLENDITHSAPQCFYFHKEQHDDFISSKFLLALEDLDTLGYSQRHIFLQKTEVLAVLDQLAFFHSKFLGIQKKQPDLQSGSYWTLDKRPPNELDGLHEKWLDFCKRFEEVDVLYKSENIRLLGQRLLKWTPWIQEEMKKIFNKQHLTTLIHGDCKSANVLFKNDNGKLRVSMIDFQWSGIGIGISDVMYLVSGADNNELGLDNFAKEKFYVNYYVTQLKEKYGIDYSLKEALHDFFIMMLDFSRIVLAYFFQGVTPAIIVKCSKDPGELSYTSSLPHLAEYLKYIDLLLSVLETHNCMKFDV